MVPTVAKHFTHAVVVIAVLFAGAAAAQIEGDAPEQALVDPTAIVVLPVEARTVESGYQELADLAYAELLARLRERQDLNIVDPSRVEAYAGTELEPAEVGRQLGAERTLESYVAPHKQGYVLTYRVHLSDGSAPHSGSGMSFERWQPGGGLHRYIRKTIDRLVETIGPNAANDEALAAYLDKRDASLARFLDTRLDGRTRWSALHELTPPRVTGYPSTYSDEGAFATPEVVAAAIDLGLHSNDDKVRGGVWKVMAGVPNPALIEPLLYALDNDPVAWNRAAAAEALALYRHEFAVANALLATAESDTSLRVRNAALVAGARPSKRRAVLERIVMDESLPTDERLLWLYTLKGFVRAENRGASDDLLLSLQKFSEESDDDRVVSSVRIVMGDAGGLTAARLLRKALDEATSESDRASVTSALDKVSSEPGITELLNELSLNDPSPLVREAAKDALERASR